MIIQVLKFKTDTQIDDIKTKVIYNCQKKMEVSF